MKARVESLRDIGPALSPFNSFLFLQGLETLHLRMDRHVQNAQKIAEFLADHPLVSWVNYPGLADCPYHALAQKYMPKGAGAIFCFGVKGGRETGKAFIESLEMFSTSPMSAMPRHWSFTRPARRISRCPTRSKSPPGSARISSASRSASRIRPTSSGISIRRLRKRPDSPPSAQEHEPWLS